MNNYGRKDAIMDASVLKGMITNAIPPQQQEVKISIDYALSALIQEVDILEKLIEDTRSYLYRVIKSDTLTSVSASELTGNVRAPESPVQSDINNIRIRVYNARNTLANLLLQLDF